jgi:hypothetical protein
MTPEDYAQQAEDEAVESFLVERDEEAAEREERIERDEPND